MTPQDISACFERFRSTVVRVEARSSYSVTGEGGLRSVRTSPFLARIARTTLVDGKSWTHLRVVDDPLSGYQRDQLTRAAVEAHACGEDYHVVPRELAGWPPDFWLFDADEPDPYALVLSYDDDGTPDGGDEIVTDVAGLDALRGHARRITDHAVPLETFLAGLRG